jgi:hypothetical protein
MQENCTTSWTEEGIHVIQRGINKRPSRVKGGYSPYEAMFGKKKGNGPIDVLDKYVLNQCVTEAGLEAAVAFVQSDEYAIERFSPNFNDRIIPSTGMNESSHMPQVGRH